MLALDKKDNQVYSYNPSMEDLADMAARNKEFAARIKDRREDFRRWMLAMAFLNGKHWTRYSRETGQIETLPETSGDKLRVTVNLIRPAFMNVMAMLTQNPSECDIVPPTDSFKDENVTKSATAHLRRIDEINQTIVKDAWLAALCLQFGVGYRFITWNPKAGNLVDTIGWRDKYGVDQGKIPADDEEGEWYLKWVKEGEIEENILAPFEVLLPVGHKMGMLITDFMMPILMPKEDIEARWENGKYVTRDDNETTYTVKELAKGMKDFYQDADPDRELFLVKQQMLGKTDDLPNGELYIWCGNVKLYQGPVPHRQGKVCLVDYHFGDDVINFYNSSYIDPLIPIQVSINRLVTVLNQWAAKSLRWVWAMPKLARISKEKLFGAQTGEIGIEYPSTFTSNPVQIVDPPRVPPEAFTLLNSLLSWFDRIALNAEVSRGDVPGRVEAAAAIERLQESEARPLVPILRSWEKKDEEVVRLKLEFIRDYWPRERTMLVAGENGDWETYSLKGADISPNIDLVVTRGSALPRSKAAQNAYYFQLLNSGGLGNLSENPMVQKRFLRALELKGLSGLFGDIDQGFEQQKREIREMAKGAKYVEVEDYQDHYSANIVLIKYLNSRDYLQLKKDHPERATNILKHWEDHARKIAGESEDLEIPPGTAETKEPGQASAPKQPETVGV